MALGQKDNMNRTLYVRGASEAPRRLSVCSEHVDMEEENDASYR